MTFRESMRWFRITTLTLNKYINNSRDVYGQGMIYTTYPNTNNYKLIDHWDKMYFSYKNKSTFSLLTGNVVNDKYDPTTLSKEEIWSKDEMSLYDYYNTVFKNTHFFNMLQFKKNFDYDLTNTELEQPDLEPSKDNMRDKFMYENIDKILKYKFRYCGYLRDIDAKLCSDTEHNKFWNLYANGNFDIELKPDPEMSLTDFVEKDDSTLSQDSKNYGGFLPYKWKDNPSQVLTQINTRYIPHMFPKYSDNAKTNITLSKDNNVDRWTQLNDKYLEYYNNADANSRRNLHIGDMYRYIKGITNFEREAEKYYDSTEHNKHMYQDEDDQDNHKRLIKETLLMSNYMKLGNAESLGLPKGYNTSKKWYNDGYGIFTANPRSLLINTFYKGVLPYIMYKYMHNYTVLPMGSILTIDGEFGLYQGNSAVTPTHFRFKWRNFKDLLTDFTRDDIAARAFNNTTNMFKLEDKKMGVGTGATSTEDLMNVLAYLIPRHDRTKPMPKIKANIFSIHQYSFVDIALLYIYQNKKLNYLLKKNTTTDSSVDVNSPVPMIESVYARQAHEKKLIFNNPYDYGKQSDDSTPISGYGNLHELRLGQDDVILNPDKTIKKVTKTILGKPVEMNAITAPMDEGLLRKGIIQPKQYIGGGSLTAPVEDKVAANNRRNTIKLNMFPGDVADEHYKIFGDRTFRLEDPTNPNNHTIVVENKPYGDDYPEDIKDIKRKLFYIRNSFLIATTCYRAANAWINYMSSSPSVYDGMKTRGGLGVWLNPSSTNRKSANFETISSRAYQNDALDKSTDFRWYLNLPDTGLFRNMPYYVPLDMYNTIYYGSKTQGKFTVGEDVPLHDIFQSFKEYNKYKNDFEKPTTYNSSFINTMWELVYGIEVTNRYSHPTASDDGQSEIIPFRYDPENSHKTVHSLVRNKLRSPIMNCRCVEGWGDPNATHILTGGMMAGSSDYCIVDDMIVMGTFEHRKQIMDNIHVLQLVMYKWDRLNNNPNSDLTDFYDQLLEDSESPSYLKHHIKQMEYTGTYGHASITHFARIYTETKKMLNKYKDWIVDLLCTVSPMNSMPLVDLNNISAIDLQRYTFMHRNNFASYDAPIFTYTSTSKRDFDTDHPLHKYVTTLGDIVTQFILETGELGKKANGYFIRETQNAMDSDVYYKHVGALEDMIIRLSDEFKRITKHDIDTFDPDATPKIKPARYFHEDGKVINNLEKLWGSYFDNKGITNLDALLNIFKEDGSFNDQLGVGNFEGGPELMNNLLKKLNLAQRFKDITKLIKDIHNRANKNDLNMNDNLMIKLKDELNKLTFLEDNAYLSMTGDVTEADKFITENSNNEWGPAVGNSAKYFSNLMGMYLAAYVNKHIVGNIDIGLPIWNILNNPNNVEKSNKLKSELKEQLTTVFNAIATGQVNPSLVERVDDAFISVRSNGLKGINSTLIGLGESTLTEFEQNMSTLRNFLVEESKEIHEVADVYEKHNPLLLSNYSLTPDQKKIYDANFSKMMKQIRDAGGMSVMYPVMSAINDVMKKMLKLSEDENYKKPSKQKIAKDESVKIINNAIDSAITRLSNINTNSKYIMDRIKNNEPIDHIDTNVLTLFNNPDKINSAVRTLTGFKELLTEAVTNAVIKNYGDVVPEDENYYRDKISKVLDMQIHSDTTTMSINMLRNVFNEDGTIVDDPVYDGLGAGKDLLDKYVKHLNFKGLFNEITDVFSKMVLYVSTGYTNNKTEYDKQANKLVELFKNANTTLAKLEIESASFVEKNKNEGWINIVKNTFEVFKNMYIHYMDYVTDVCFVPGKVDALLASPAFVLPSLYTLLNQDPSASSTVSETLKHDIANFFGEVMSNKDLIPEVDKLYDGTSGFEIDGFSNNQDYTIGNGGFAGEYLNEFAENNLTKFKSKMPSLFEFINDIMGQVANAAELIKYDYHFLNEYKKLDDRTRSGFDALLSNVIGYDNNDLLISAPVMKVLATIINKLKELSLNGKYLNKTTKEEYGRQVKEINNDLFTKVINYIKSDLNNYTKGYSVYAELESRMTYGRNEPRYGMYNYMTLISPTNSDLRSEGIRNTLEAFRTIISSAIDEAVVMKFKEPTIAIKPSDWLRLSKDDLNNINTEESDSNTGIDNTTTLPKLPNNYDEDLSIIRQNIMDKINDIKGSYKAPLEYRRTSPSSVNKVRDYINTLTPDNASRIRNNGEADKYMEIANDIYNRNTNMYIRDDLDPNYPYKDTPNTTLLSKTLDLIDNMELLTNNGIELNIPEGLLDKLKLILNGRPSDISKIENIINILQPNIARNNRAANISADSDRYFLDEDAHYDYIEPVPGLNKTNELNIDGVVYEDMGENTIGPDVVYTGHILSVNEGFKPRVSDGVITYNDYNDIDRGPKATHTPVYPLLNGVLNGFDGSKIPDTYIYRKKKGD